MMAGAFENYNSVWRCSCNVVVVSLTLQSNPRLLGCTIWDALSTRTVTICAILVRYGEHPIWTSGSRDLKRKKYE